MTLGLYECLKAVGLQCHYDRFTSVGICRAANLSSLTMEDYPIVGICSMEDRTRLFHLVQMVKTLDLESLEYEDCDDEYYKTDDDDKGFTVADGSITVDDFGDPGAKTKPDIMERIFTNSSHTRSSPKCASFHKPKPRPATVALKSFSSKRVGHKDRKETSRREKFNTQLSTNTASEDMTKPTPVYESKRTAGYNYGIPLSSPPASNKKLRGGQRISVCVRKRPLTLTEGRGGDADVVTTQSGECVIVNESKEAVDLTQYILQHKFYFDQVFGEESTNEEVYRGTAYPLVQHMLNGGKATCFAYGQTGAGKTHTMLGSSPGRPGLYALAVQDIFTHLSAIHTCSPLLVYVSFFEIYCGQLYDLLDHRKRLFAREDGQKVVHIAGLRDIKVDSVSSLLEVISQGIEERTQGMSGVNPLSSRSHALLQIQLRGPNQQIAGRMWFVDLAGSERASDTKEPDRQSRMEGAEINQSLLALKECIRSLDQEQTHTPFRQSKLTQVLKDSFVGDSMTCMIANISPGHLATEHTLNTLRYADRVKELRGQGRLNGGRRGKAIPSPKRNLSKSNSRSGGNNVGTRGKSPSKKPKLGRQREASGPTSPTLGLATGGAILCSTPKNGRWEEKRNGRSRTGPGLEQISPIRGLLGINVKRERRESSGGREARSRESYGGTNSAGHSINDRNTGAGLLMAHAADEQLHLWEVKRESGFCHKEKENQQSTLKEEREWKGRWMEPRRQVESSRDTCSEVERLREGNLQNLDVRDKERERHLRRYHHQLQQLKPSSASSSYHFFSPSTCSSFCLSNQASLSSSVSPSSCSSLQKSACISVSALTHGFDKVRVEVRTDGNGGQSSSFPTREMCLQTETPSSHNKNKDDVVHVGTEPGFGQERDKSEKRRALKATGDGEVRVRREDWRLVGMEGGGERRWAWVAPTETEQADRMTGARPADAEALMTFNCYSEDGGEGLDASDVQADRMWNTEEREGTDGYSLVSTHSNTESNSLFNCSPVESSHQRAPAERPLSPAYEHTNTHLTPNKLSDLTLGLKHTTSTSNILPLPLQNAQQGVPPSREVELSFAANAKKREFSNVQLAMLPLTTPITQNGCKIPAEPLYISENQAHTQVQSHPEVKGKMYLLPQGETSTGSFNYIMDPLSISLLQVDQQVATASFLQGEKNNTSVFVLKNERGEDKKKGLGKEHLTCAEMAGKVVEDEDVEVGLSLFQLPQAKTDCPPNSDTLTATNHSERRKDVCFATYENCGRGMMKPPIPEVRPVSLQDQENNPTPRTTSAIRVLDNKSHASPLKTSMGASTETFVRQSILYSVQHSGNMGSPTHNLLTDGATHMPAEYAHDMHNKLAFSISTPQSEGVLGQFNTLPKQCHTVNSNHSSNSSISLQSNNPIEIHCEESTSNLQSRPLIHLSTLEDLYHSQ